MHPLGKTVERAVLAQQQYGVGGQVGRDGDHSVALGVDCQAQSFDQAEVEQRPAREQHAHRHAFGQRHAIVRHAQRNAQRVAHREYAGGDHGRQLAQAVAESHPGLVEANVEEFLQQPDLRQLHGHDQRQCFVVGVERRFAVIAHALDQVDGPFDRVGADLAGLGQKAVYRRAVGRMGQQVRAATQIRDVVAAEREGRGT